MLHWKSNLLPRLKVLSTKGSAQFVKKYHLVQVNVVIGRKKLHCRVQTTRNSWFFTYSLLILRTSLHPQTIYPMIQTIQRSKNVRTTKWSLDSEILVSLGEECPFLYACVVCACTWYWSQVRVGMWTFRHSLTLLRFFSSLFSLICLLIQTFGENKNAEILPSRLDNLKFLIHLTNTLNH